MSGHLEDQTRTDDAINLFRSAQLALDDAINNLWSVRGTIFDSECKIRIDRILNKELPIGSEDQK